MQPEFQVGVSDPPAVILGGMTNALSVARGLATLGITTYALGPADAPVRASRHCAGFTEMSGPSLQVDMLGWLRRYGIRYSANAARVVDAAEAHGTSALAAGTAAPRGRRNRSGGRH